MIDENKYANQKLIISLFKILKNYFHDIQRNTIQGRSTWWPANDSFKIMVGAILTQNTNWKNVEKALEVIGDRLSPQFIFKTDINQLAQLIRSSGYYNQKAKKLKALTLWYKGYEFNVYKVQGVDNSKLREELLAINGVGPETADTILVYALGKTSFIIDAYTRRIFTRFGIDVPNDYSQLKLLIEESIPNDILLYDYYHGLIVEHAKLFCTKNPKCKQCPISSSCMKII